MTVRSGQLKNMHIHEIESDTEINFQKSFVKRINDDELMDSTGHRGTAGTEKIVLKWNLKGLPLSSNWFKVMLSFH